MLLNDFTIQCTPLYMRSKILSHGLNKPVHGVRIASLLFANIHTKNGKCGLKKRNNIDVCT